MSQRSSAPRTALHRAVVASVVLHLAIASAVLIWFLIPLQESPCFQAQLDTRIQVVRLACDDAKAVPVSESTSNEARPADLAQPPLVRSVPQTLSPGMISIIQHGENSSTQQPASAPSPDFHVQQAHVVTGVPAQPLHGGMKPGQSVVYLLDCSGSMGEFGKLIRAESALLATLRCQLDSVRVQVICYNSKAWPLFPTGFAALAANRENAGARLALLEARGRSNHAAAVRMAAELHPDVILWLSDAEDLALSRFSPILQAAGKSIPVYRAAILPDGVKPPQKLQ